MDWSKWFVMDWQTAMGIAFTSVVIYFGLILYTRLVTRQQILICLTISENMSS